MWLERLLEWLLALLAKGALGLEAVRECRDKLTAIWGYDESLLWPTEQPQCASLAAVDRPEMLTAPKRLTSPRRMYELRVKLAAGDLCDVHLADAAGDRYVVKTPRFAAETTNARLAQEMRILERLTEADAQYASYFPRPVETFVSEPRGPRYNVLVWEDGFYTAGEIAVRHPQGLEGRHLAWMFKRILAALGFAHRQGWIHGAVLPPHLLFHAENHGLHLAGWTHAVRVGRPLTDVPPEFEAWYPPEARRGAEPATDIYLAAKSVVYLAGGDPQHNQTPDTVPSPLWRFLQSCLLESPQMRPRDAWSLHEEFDDLLHDLYGPPRYVRLTMT